MGPSALEDPSSGRQRAGKGEGPSLAPRPPSRRPSLDATAVSGPGLSVIPDRFGSPTDMGCIGGRVGIPGGNLLDFGVFSNSKPALPSLGPGMAMVECR